MGKDLSPDELAGMTVNERLYATEQFEAFDAAVSARDEDRLREVLKRLHIGEENVEAIIRSQLKGEKR